MRTKFRVDFTFNGGQNIVLAPIKEIAAKTAYVPDIRADAILSPEVPAPEDNVAFFGASPGGEIRLLMVRPENAKEFTEGREFFVDFTPAS
jgi:hypothetical protein